MVLLLVACVLSAGQAQAPTPVQFVSAHPSYAKIALTADGQKVLLLALDESGGTDTGYDTIYADTNFNGVIEAAEKVQSTTDAGYSSFKPLNFDFPYNPQGVGVTQPLVLTLGRSYLESGVAASLRVILRQGGQNWEYTFRRALPVSTDLAKTRVLTASPLTVKLITRTGNGLGLAASLSAGDFDISTYTPQGSPRVRLLVQGTDGQTASDTTVPLDRLGYG